MVDSPFFMSRKWVLLCAAVALGGASPTMAATPLVTRAGVHAEFDRIVFDGPPGLKYTLNRQGEKVVLTFNQDVEANLKAFSRLGRAQGFVFGAAANTVIFVASPQSKLHDFRSDNAIVIDVTGPSAPKEMAAVAENNAASAQPLSAKNTAPLGPKPEAKKVNIGGEPKSQEPTVRLQSIEKTVAHSGPTLANALGHQPPSQNAVQVQTNDFGETTLQGGMVSASGAKANSGETDKAHGNGLKGEKQHNEQQKGEQQTGEKGAEETVKGNVPSPPPAVAAPFDNAAARPAEASTTEAVSAPQLPADLPKLAPPTLQVDANGKAEAISPVSVAPISYSALPPSKLKPQEFPDIGEVPVLMASLDPGLETGAVIYARAGFGYIVFDRNIVVDINKLAQPDEKPKMELEPIDLKHVSGFRFIMPPDMKLRAKRNGNAWQIYFLKAKEEVLVSSGLVAQPEFPLGSRMILPVENPPEPIYFTDPIVGDKLIFLPLHEVLTFAIPRKLADFEILESAQGLVIKPLQDKVVVRSAEEGLEISAAGGLKLSPPSDTGDAHQTEENAANKASGQSIFNLTEWRSKPGETFTRARQRYMQTIADVPEAQRNRARLDLARFYFAEGLGQEAHSLLQYLVRKVPNIESHPEFLTLRGAARVLIDQPQEALDDFDRSQQNFAPEIELWSAVALTKLGEWKKAEEKFGLTEQILNGYPEPFYSRFSVLAIEAAIAAGKDHEAAIWLDRMETTAHSERVDPALLYLRGVINAHEGRADVAQSLWKQVADSEDRLYRIRAELALVDLGVATHSLTPLQAAERLEGLRYAWRGDGLELDILHRLGAFYIDAGKYREGLGVLSRGVKLYPNSPMTPAIRDEMAKTFQSIFLGDTIRTMSPIEALALYQDYGELIPKGDDAKLVRHNLAERLVAIDLLDQAANLLQIEMDTDPAGEVKAKTGARLAGIRVLDHRSDEAIKALDASKADNLPVDLDRERKLLRARALSEQHKEDEAIELLKDDNSLNAKLLRADITMRAKRWAEAANALTDLIGPPPDAGQTLTGLQTQWIVNAAIALSLAGDTVRLDKLAIDFGTAMSHSTQADTFRILTRPETMGQMRDMAAVQSRISEVDMFRDFLDNYRNPSAHETTAATPAEADPLAGGASKPVNAAPLPVTAPSEEHSAAPESMVPNSSASSSVPTAEKADHSGKTEHTEKPAAAEKTSTSEKPAISEKPAVSEKRTTSEKQINSEKTAVPEKSGTPEKQVNPDQTAKPKSAP